MADFTKTVSNTINVFGGSPTSNWGVMIWGTDKWGEGSVDLPVAVEKLIENTQSFSDDYSNEVEHSVDMGSVTVSSETVSEGLQDGSGYSYVFPGPTTENENKNISNWSSATADTETWTSGSVGSTTWSE